MLKERTIFILGLLVAILPFMGFPNNWKKVLFLLTGLIIAYLAYLLYRVQKNTSSIKENRSNTYTDNRHESSN